MRSTILMLSALVTGVAISAPAATFAAPMTQQAKKLRANLIQGRVVDANGRSVADALVTIEDENSETVAETRTDARGFYEISVPASGNASSAYSLRIRRIGFTPVVMSLVQSNGYWSTAASVTMYQFTLQPQN